MLAEQFTADTIDKHEGTIIQHLDTPEINVGTLRNEYIRNIIVDRRKELPSS